VKEFRKSTYICRSYDQKSSVLFLDTVYILAWFLMPEAINLVQVISSRTGLVPSA